MINNTNCSSRWREFIKLAANTCSEADVEIFKMVALKANKYSGFDIASLHENYGLRYGYPLG